MAMTQGAPVNNKAKVLIVEDHIVVREGFVALVSREADLEVCGQSDSAFEALDLIQKMAPDIVVVDLILKDGDGLELIKSIRARYPQVAMLVVSMQDEEIYAERALRAGARGYIMKSSATDEFLDAMRAVLAGQIFVSRKMNVRILYKFANGTCAPDPNPPGQLTDRELEIFRLVGSGMPTRKIAAHLGISAKTVESHRENIKQKLVLDSATALVQAATDWVDRKPR
jgi:DNA-binding NarL/FixJ family response regulator